MKHKIFFTLIIFILGVWAVSCAQDPIFYIISTEKPLQKAYIPGTPTKMAVFEREYSDPDPLSPPGSKIKIPILYVASGTKLHWYAKEGQTVSQSPGVSKWDLSEYSIPQPTGKIIDIAAAGDCLYALCQNENSLDATLRYIKNDGNKWEPISPGDIGEYTVIQTIFADPEKEHVFAGASNKTVTSYAILYLNNSGSGPQLELLESNTELLNGAAFKDNKYFLATNGKGIYRVDVDTTGINTATKKQFEDNSDDKKNDRLFKGIIRLDDGTIIAVERGDGSLNSALYEVEDDSFSRMKYTGTGNNITVGPYSTGALALWKNPQNEDIKILTVGLQTNLYSDTSYTNGYVEFELNADGSFNKDKVRENLPSVTVHGNTERYTTSIGQNSINYMFQAPDKIDKEMTFFASTHKDGLWSYRFIDGEWQWNAETNER